MLMTYVCYCIVMYFNEKIIYRLGVVKMDAVLDAQGSLEEESGLEPVSPGGTQITPKRRASESSLRASGAEEQPPAPPRDTATASRRNSLPASLPSENTSASRRHSLPASLPIETIPAPPRHTVPAPPAGAGVGDISIATPQGQGGKAGQEGGRGAVSPTVFGDAEEPRMSSKQSWQSWQSWQVEKRRPPRKSSEELLQTRDPLGALWAAFMPVPGPQTWSALVISLLSLSCLSYLLVDAATRVSVVLHVSSFAIGLLIVAPAISWTALARAIDCAKEGEADRLVANCFSDSLFDILVSLGLPWFVHSMGGTVKLSDKTQSFMQINLLILLALLLVILLAFQVLKLSVTRRMSMLLLAAYGAYWLGIFAAMCAGVGVV